MFFGQTMYCFGLLIAGFVALLAFIWGFLDMQKEDQDEWQEYIEAFKERIGQ